jgi:hypothetical protein
MQEDMNITMMRRGKERKVSAIKAKVECERYDEMSEAKPRIQQVNKFTAARTHSIGSWRARFHGCRISETLAV